jgi:DNA polymerase III subunit alpha
VFQLDGGPMRSLLRSMRPDKFADISAVGALYRPGPMGMNSHNEYADRKNGRKPVTALHPELAEPLAEILGETYGLIVYQEQVMAVAQKVAGYSLGAADLLRRAMGKKKKAELDAQRETFRAGMVERGFSEGAIKTLWDTLLPFSDYAFNKAHSAAYGLVSYWTAYLKANYPAEYMAALLTSVRDDKDKSALYLNECRRMGIKVLPPDVNESAAEFTPVGTDIRFGLAAIRNVGANVVEKVREAREDKGRFTTFKDFLRKVDPVVCNKRTVESLIKAGAFDSLGHSRAALTNHHDRFVDAALAAKAGNVDQGSLFDVGLSEEPILDEFAGLPEPDGPEWDKSMLLTFERDMLGLYVSDHPLLGVEHVLARLVDAPIAQVMADEARPDGSVLSLAGLISSLQFKTTKQGKPWALATLEDLEGAIEVLFFPQTFEQVRNLLRQDLICVVRGRLNRRDDVPTLYAMELTIPDVTEAPRGPVVISLAPTKLTPPVAEQLKDVLADHPGVTEVHVRLEQPGHSTVLRLDDGLRVTASPALFGDLKHLLGPSCLVS